MGPARFRGQGYERVAGQKADKAANTKVSRSYYENAVLNSSNMYILTSNSVRRDNFINSANFYLNNHIESTAESREFTARESSFIKKTISEENALAKQLLKTLGQPIKARNARVELARFLTTNYSDTFTEFGFDPVVLSDVVAYAFKQYIDSNEGQSKILNKSTLVTTSNYQDLSSRYNKVKNDSKLEADCIKAIKMLRESENKYDLLLTSPFLIRLLEMLRGRFGHISSVGGIPGLYGKGAVLYEVVALLAMGRMFSQIANKQKKDFKLELEHVGSTAAANFSQSQLVTDLGNMMDNTLYNPKGKGKTDLIITVEDIRLRVDLKLPDNSTSDVYQVETPTHKYEHLNASSTEDIKYLNVVLNALANEMMTSEKDIERNQSVNRLLRYIAALVATSNLTAQSFVGFTTNEDKSKTLLRSERADLVLVGKEFYWFSDIYKALRYTYVNRVVRQGATDPTTYANTTFKVGGTTTAMSNILALKPDLMEAKRKALALVPKNKDGRRERFENRLSYILDDPETAALFKKVAEAMKSLSYKQKLTLSINQAVRYYPRSRN